MGVENNMGRLYFVKNALVNACLDVPWVKADTGCGIRLRISIDEQGFVFQYGQTRTKIYGSGRFTHATFLIRDGYYLTHGHRVVNGCLYALFRRLALLSCSFTFSNRLLENDVTKGYF
jgi:hypothetical protein